MTLKHLGHLVLYTIDTGLVSYENFLGKIGFQN